nr:hypothetical protein [Mycoplasmopsis canis]WQQ12310.1 hypothetical protein RRG48_02900 [Mycoplasmopsis canis]
MKVKKQILWITKIIGCTVLPLASSCSNVKNEYKNDSEYQKELKLTINKLEKLKEKEKITKLLESATSLEDLKILNHIIDLKLNSQNNEKQNLEEENILDTFGEENGANFLKIVNPGGLYAHIKSEGKLVYDYKNKTVVGVAKEAKINWKEINYQTQTFLERNEFQNEFQAINDKEPTYTENGKTKTNIVLNYKFEKNILTINYRLFQFDNANSKYSNKVFSQKFEINENAETKIYTPLKSNQNTSPEKPKKKQSSGYKNAFRFKKWLTQEEIITKLTQNPSGIKYIPSKNVYILMNSKDTEDNEILVKKSSKKIQGANILNNKYVDNKGENNFVDAHFDSDKKIFTIKYRVNEEPDKLFIQTFDFNKPFETNFSTTIEEIDSSKDVPQTNGDNNQN